MIAALLLSMSLNGTQTMGTSLQIPFHPKEVGHCYQKLSKMRPVYREGVDRIRQLLEGSGSIADRFDAAIEAHREIRTRAKSEPPIKDFVEEDFYLCCVYDMLQAAVGAEVESILNSGDGKKKRLDEVMTAIKALPFGSPQYKTGILPRMEKQVQDAVAKLKASK